MRAVAALKELGEGGGGGGGGGRGGGWGWGVGRERAGSARFEKMSANKILGFE